MNALLSFGYVLVGSELQALLDGIGFDPYLGFYHQIDYGRPSLALDLLEELRAALVDRMSLTWLTRNVFQRDDFTRNPDGGIRFHRQSLKRFFPLYQEQLTTPQELDGETLTFRDLFRRQAERLERALTEGGPIGPFACDPGLRLTSFPWSGVLLERNGSSGGLRVL